MTKLLDTISSPPPIPETVQFPLYKHIVASDASKAVLLVIMAPGVVYQYELPPQLMDAWFKDWREARKNAEAIGRVISTIPRSRND